MRVIRSGGGAGTMRLYRHRDGRRTVASFTYDTDPGIGPMTMYDLSPVANTRIVSGTRAELDTVAEIAETDARYTTGPYADTLRALAASLRAMPGDDEPDAGQPADTARPMAAVRAATIRVGDITPAGTVEAVEYAGQLLRVFLTIGGQTYTRRYDDLVSVTR